MNQSPQLPELAPDESRERRRRVLPGIPWFPRQIPGGQFFGYSLQGLVASKFGIIAMIGGLIAGTAVVGTEMSDYIRRPGSGSRTGARVNPNYSKVKLNPAAPGSLPTDAWQDPNSLGLLAKANASGTAGGAGSASADADARAAGAGAGTDGAGADAGKGGDKSGQGKDGADKDKDKDAAASLDKALAAGPGFGANGAGFGAGGRPQLAPMASLFGQSGGSSMASWGGGAGVGGAGKGEGASGSADSGKLSAFSRNPTAANVSSSRVPRAMRVGGKNANFDRLAQLNKDIKPTVGMRGEQGPAYQTAAWEATPTSGGGTGDGGNGAGNGGGNPSSNGGYNGPTANSGGPVLPTSSVGNPTTPPAVPAPANVSPWQNLLNIAVALLAAASILLTIAGILGMIHMPWTYMVGKWLSYIAAALAAAVTIIGIMIMGQGQYTQGLIFTGVGALVTALAMISAEGFKDSSKPVGQQLADKGKEIGSTAGKTLGEVGKGIASRLPGVVATMGGLGGTAVAINEAADPNYVRGSISTTTSSPPVSSTPVSTTPAGGGSGPGGTGPTSTTPGTAKLLDDAKAAAKNLGTS